MRNSSLTHRVEQGILVLVSLVAAYAEPSDNLVLPDLPGLPDLSFQTQQGPNGPVNALAEADDGFIYVAGEFDSFGSTETGNLIRLSPDGDLDSSFTPEARGSIYALQLLPDGNLLVGGGQLRFGDIDSNYLARLLPSGQVHKPFSQAVQPNGSVRAIQIDNHARIWIAGNFTRVSGSPRIRIAKLLDTGATDPSFSPRGGPNGEVHTLAIDSENRLLVGGEFDAIHETPSPLVGRFSPDGTLDRPFAANLGDPPPHRAIVRSLAIDDRGRILIAGKYRISGSGKAYNHLLIRTSDGRVDPDFEGRLLSAPDGLWQVSTTSENTFWIAGSLLEVDRVRRPGLARLFDDGALDEGFHPIWGLGSSPIPFLHKSIEVRTVHILSDGKILIAGSFDIYQGIPTRNLLRLHGGEIGKFPPKILEAPQSIDRVEGQPLNLQAIGVANPHPTFQWRRGGVPVSSDLTIAVFMDTDGNQATSWHTTSTSSSSAPVLSINETRLNDAGNYTLEVQNSEGLAISHTNVRIVPREPTPGSLDVRFRPHPFSGALSAVAAEPLPNGQLLVTGSTQISGTPVESNQVIRYNADGSIDHGFAALQGFGFPPEAGHRFSGTVETVRGQASGHILLGGEFVIERDGELLGRNLIRLLPNGDFDPTFQGGQATNGRVQQIHSLPDQTLWITGLFTQVHELPANGLFRLTRDGAPHPAFDPERFLGGNIQDAFVDPQGRFVIAGKIDEYDGRPVPNVVRVDASGILDPSLAQGNPIFPFISEIEPGPGHSIYILGEPTLPTIEDAPPLIRIVANGDPDPTFAPFSGFWRAHRITAMASDPPNGFLYAAVSDRQGTTPIRPLIRLKSDGTIDPSFAAHEWLPPRDRPTIHQLHVQPAFGLTALGGFSWIDGAPRYRIARFYTETPAIEPPTFLALPRDRTAIHGTGISLGAPAKGYPAPEYHWFKDDQRLEGERNATLNLAFVRSSDAGSYRVEASNAEGSVFSEPFTVRIERGHPGSQNFDFAVPSNLTGTINSMLITPQDAVILAGHFDTKSGGPPMHLVRLRETGHIDPTFQRIEAEDSTIRSVARTPTGTLLIGGGFQRIHALPRNRLAVLNPDGIVLPDIDPGAQLEFIEPNKPNTWHILAVAADTAGQFYAAGRFRVAGHPSVEGLARFQPDGTWDHTFQPTLSELAIQQILPHPDGDVWVATSAGKISRLATDGTTRETLEAPNQGRRFRGDLTLLPDHSIVIAGKSLKANDRRLLERWRPASGIDPEWSTHDDAPPHGYLLAATTDPTAGVVAATAVWELPGVLRIDGSTGELDPTFRAPVQLRSVKHLATFSDGDILAAGRYHNPRHGAQWLIRLFGARPAEDASSIVSLVMDRAATGIPIRLHLKQAQTGLYELEFKESLDPEESWRPWGTVEIGGVMDEPSIAIFPDHSTRFYRIAPDPTR